jgi:ATP-dependent RNA helicase DeaD
LENDNKSSSSKEPKVNKYITKIDNDSARAIPEDEQLKPMTLDESPPEIQEACKSAKWDSLMDVQSKTLPYFMAKKDIMVQSRTGSGKTGAFILPMLPFIEPGKGACQALILVPTRELATQVSREAEMLGSHSEIRVVSVYGGTPYDSQIKAFNSGVEIVVATPGRLLDHLMRGGLTLKNLKFLIFDEADRMLSMGFFPDMKQVRSYLPKTKINGYMFSATFPGEVLHLAYQFLNKPELLSLSRDHVHVTDNEHRFYIVPPMHRAKSLVSVIEYENPKSAIIFCNRKDDVHYVAVVLNKYGYTSGELSSDLPQKAREQVMDRLRKGEISFLVATDVAARGIDIPELSHVFQYGPPDDVESYIHRSGRTGRAGHSGTAIILVTDVEKLHINKIAKIYDIDFTEATLPDEEALSKIVGERVTAMLESKLRNLTRHQKENLSRFLPLAKEFGEAGDELSLVALMLNDFYRNSLFPQPVVEKRDPSIERVSKKSGNSGYGQERRPSKGRGDRGGRDSSRYSGSRSTGGSNQRNSSHSNQKRSGTYRKK